MIKTPLLTLLLFLNFSAVVYASGEAVILRATEVEATGQYHNTYSQMYTNAEYSSDSLKYYDIVYWKERHSIHFYEFPNGYNASFCQSTLKDNQTEEECIHHREQHVLQVSDIGNGSRQSMSANAAEAYKAFTAYVAQKHPTAKHGLSFTGHGSPGGTLFHGLVYPAHAQKILWDWSVALGKKLSFVDMGGPCNKGSYGDLNMVCPFSEYYIASDLPNSGFLPNKEYTDENYSNDGGIADIDVQYHRIFRDHTDTLDAMKARIDVRQFSYDRATDHIVDLKNGVAHTASFLPYEQANYLYSCESFKKLYDTVNNDNIISSPRVDLRNYFQSKYSNPKLSEVNTLFDATIVYKADTRDIAAWVDHAGSNGMLAAARGLATEPDGDPSKLAYPVIDYPVVIPPVQSEFIPVIHYLLF